MFVAFPGWGYRFHRFNAVVFNLPVVPTCLIVKQIARVWCCNQLWLNPKDFTAPRMRRKYCLMRTPTKKTFKSYLPLREFTSKISKLLLLSEGLMTGRGC